FKSIRNILVDLNGGVFIADAQAARIRYVNPTNGVIQGYAGSGTQGFGADGIPPASTTFLNLADIAFAPGGGLYVADAGRIRKLNPATQFNATVAGDASGAMGSTGDGGPPSSALFQQVFGITQYLNPQSPGDDVLLASDGFDHVLRFVNFTKNSTTLVA